jgi:hypothetical protein
LPRCKANGQLPGHRFTAESGRSLEIDLAMQLDSHDPVAMIQIIRDGRIERQVSYEQWQRSGSLGKIRFENSGWFLIRVLADHEKTFRFASTAPWYVQVGDQPRVSRASVQFFLDWLAERRDRVKLADPSQLQEVLSHHDAARAFWQERLSRANAP